LANVAAQVHVASARARASLRGPTATTTVTNLIILGSSALGGIVSARALGPAGRGQLAIVVLWSALISMVGIVGLPSSCSYYVARWPDRRATLATFFSRIALRQALVMTVISGAVMWWLHVRLRLPSPLVMEYVTWAGGTAVALYGTCYVQGLGDFRRFNAIRSIPGILPAVLMLGATVTVRLTPAEAGAAYLIPAWCSASVAWTWLRRAGRGGGARRLSHHDRRSIRSYGWRSLASFSGLALNRSADQLVLGLVVPAGSLGLYSVAAAASTPLPSLVASLGMVGLPTISALTGPAKATATWKALWRGACILALVAPLVALILPRAIPLVYGAHYASAVVPAELLLAGAVFTALTSVADDLLRAHGHPGFVSLSQGAGGAVTIIGALLLARRSLAAVALISSAGFAVAFVLALIRLRAAPHDRQFDHG
jgi:O-antigen/teichoic acid export membrane protein